MAIYRAEQARLSFASEAGRSGYMEHATADQETGGGDTTINAPAGYPAGTRVIVVNTITDFFTRDYIQIGAAPTSEIRKILRIDGTSIFLTHPTGFPHANGEAVVELVGHDTFAAVTPANPNPANLAGRNFMTFFPGVYETINTPDLTPEFTPHYIASNKNDRNFSIMYRGRQSYQGSLPNFVLLNGYPLKYVLGEVQTRGMEMGASSVLNGATNVGTQTIEVDDVDAANEVFLLGNYIRIGDNTVDVTMRTNPSEVRQITNIDAANDIITLNYPLMLPHADDAIVQEVTEHFTHDIVERSLLPTMTWNVLMVDSAETVNNNFLRRYVGGIINRATLSAEEGGLLMLAWDDIQFQDLLHNQPYHQTNTTENVLKANQAMLLPGDTADQNAVYGDIGGDISYDSSGVVERPVYPSTDPYYFSEGL